MCNLNINVKIDVCLEEDHDQTNIMPLSSGRRDILKVKVLRCQRRGFGRTLCEGNSK